MKLYATYYLLDCNNDLNEMNSFGLVNLRVCEK